MALVGLACCCAVPAALHSQPARRFWGAPDCDRSLQLCSQLPTLSALGHLLTVLARAREPCRAALLTPAVCDARQQHTQGAAGRCPLTGRPAAVKQAAQAAGWRAGGRGRPCQASHAPASRSELSCRRRCRRRRRRRATRAAASAGAWRPRSFNNAASGASAGSRAGNSSSSGTSGDGSWISGPSSAAGGSARFWTASRCRRRSRPSAGGSTGGAAAYCAASSSPASSSAASSSCSSEGRA